MQFRKKQKRREEDGRGVCSKGRRDLGECREEPGGSFICDLLLKEHSSRKNQTNAKGYVSTLLPPLSREQTSLETEWKAIISLLEQLL